MNTYNDFADWLRALRYGELNDELTAKLKELVQAVESTEKVGTLTIKIALKPSHGSALEIVDDVAMKKPELARGSTLMFPTPQGNLQRNDPRQPELPEIRVVDDRSAPLDIYKDAS